MLVRHLASFLLDLTFPKTIDTTHIRRLADGTGDRRVCITMRPIRTPITRRPMRA
jgi:hypothetical protein